MDWALPEITGKVGTITTAAATGLALGGRLGYLKTMDELQLLNDWIPIALAAATGGHLTVLNWLTTTRYWPGDLKVKFAMNMNRALYAAAKNGHLDTVIWFKDYLPSLGEAYCGAGEGGHLDILKWLKKNNTGYRRNPSQFAAKSGNLEALLWFKENGFPWTQETINGAAIGGKLETYLYLVNNGAPVNTTYITDYASCSGNIQLIEYLHKSGRKTKSCAIAAEKGHLEAVKWLRKENVAWGENAAKLAAMGGYLPVVRYVLENGFPYTPDCASLAAKRGHLEVLQYLHEKGYEIDEECSSNAAENGYLDILQWLHRNGYKMASNCYSLAANNGDFKTMKYLADIGEAKENML